MIEQFNFKYLIRKVVPCTSYMHGSVQHSIHAQKQQFRKFVIAPCKLCAECLPATRLCIIVQS